ncbi:hypothetical protein FQR65_LT16838 [Abscondita terminalis]|nr:hypothetical protein FQR65_LT16838 [Abscondita terminalis]
MCDDNAACGFELETGRHILIKNDKGDIVQGANGTWLRTHYMTPSEELLKFFNIVEDTNNFSESNEPYFEADSHCSSSAQPGPSGSGSSRWERDAILTLISIYKENINNFKNSTMKNEHCSSTVPGSLLARNLNLGWGYLNVGCPCFPLFGSDRECSRTLGGVWGGPGQFVTARG